MSTIRIALLLVGCALPTAPSDTPILDRLRARPLAYTRHARCRMDCRKISEEEVRAVLATGALDPSRTRQDGSCPSYAVEGRSRDGQNLRIVYGGCDDVTLVITAIDLDTRWPCTCE